MSIASLPLPALAAIFVAAAAIVWWAGVRLSNTTDILDRRLGWGHALGGLVLLALVTDLPDIAIVVSAAIGGNPGLATGTLLGGVAVQTVVIAIVDFAGGRSGVPLTSRTKSLIPALEALMVIVGLAIVILGSQMDPVTWFRVEPAGVVIPLAWLGGVLVVRRARSGLAWQLDESEEEGESGSGGSGDDEQVRDRSMARVVATFAFAAVLTVAGGVAMERSGDQIASELGIEGVVFGATFLAIATALPDISTGVQAVRLDDNQLALSDVLGASAFLPSLFLLAGILSGNAVIATTSRTNVYLGGLGVALLAPYLVGLVFRSKRMVFRMGYDSLAVIVIYLVGVAGLIFLV